KVMSHLDHQGLATVSRVCKSWHEAATADALLCSACAGAYADPNPSQRLVTKTHAQYLYRMRPADLAALPHAVASNPINPAFLPMHLFRKADVEEAAWEKKRTSTKSVR
ncbi:hypothetical protein APUTEX25_000247, partial [Auxenochlorella protothecoides]